VVTASGGRTGTFTPRDPGYEARVRASFAAQPMMATLGAEIAGIGPGWIDLEFPHRVGLTQQDGFVHAGAMAAALDSACGYAAFTLMPEDATVLTAEFKLNLLRPAKADRYLVSARVVKPGRTLAVAQATAVADGGTEPIALMTGTLVALAASGTDR
jgi:uncharacterized protein (TIGR00369 family)